jgi:hypothetical protein
MVMESKILITTTNSIENSEIGWLMVSGTIFIKWFLTPLIPRCFRDFK